MVLEASTRYLIDTILTNKRWCLDSGSKDRNVFLEEPKKHHKALLKGKRPDYVLYRSGTDQVLAIIEAKKGGEPLEQALEQGTQYAKVLNAPLVFAMNNRSAMTRYVGEGVGYGQELILNGKEVRELLREKECLKFLEEQSNDVYTIPKEVIKSRQELIGIFASLNDALRREGLRAGLERFSEFANVLFLKLLCENEEDRFTWWADLKGTSDAFLIDAFNTCMARLEDKYGGNVFESLNIKDPQTLKTIIHRLDTLQLSEIGSDVKGDAFEYFIKASTSNKNNDLGEYFTPRHIVRAMVNLVAPKYGETVYDPFCGTGGFLTESYNYIRENSLIDTAEKTEFLKHHTLYGTEITTNARIAKMSMILHGDGHSGVTQQNTLLNPVDQKYDVIITNIPFSLKDVGVESQLYQNGLAKNRGDGVCLLHCLRALKPGGRMAVVVPEGVLFRKDMQQVRQFLKDHADLQAIVSLPQGVFNPYTAVKTSILYFVNAHKPQGKRNYWFFKVENDGYSLDAHRRPLKGINDLYKLERTNIQKAERENKLEILKESGFLVGTTKKTTWIVSSLESEQKTADIKSLENLVADKIISVAKGKMITKETANTSGSIPVIAGGQSSPYNHDCSNTVQTPCITMSASGAYSGYIWYHDTAIWASDCTVLYSDDSILRTKYLYHFLKYSQASIYSLQRGSGQPHVYWKDIDSFSLPVCSVKQQDAIVQELERYDTIIRSAQTILDTWKPEIQINPDWATVTLGEVTTIESGGTPSTQENTYWEDGTIPWVTLVDMKRPYLTQTERQISEKGLKNSSAKLLPLNTVVFSSRATIGRIAISKVPLTTNQGFKNFICTDRILPEYLYYILKQDVIKKEIETLASGTTYLEISKTDIAGVFIPLPSLAEQQMIVDELEAQRTLIEQQKQVIETFTAKKEQRLKEIFG